MRLLDRYLAKKFLFTLCFPIIAFISIFIVIDLVERLSDYIDRGVPGLVIASYYFYFTPYIIVLMFPIAMLLAALFSIGQLSKYNELTAMKASGVSLYRILAPIYLIAFTLSLGLMLFAEKVVPVANQRKAEIKDRHMDRMPQNLPARLSNIYLQNYVPTTSASPTTQGGSRRVFIGFYNAEAKVAEKVSIQDYEGVFILHRIDANTLRWHENAWLATHGYERTFSNGGEVAAKFDTLPLPNLFFTPEVLNQVQKDPEEMSFGELQQFITEVANNGGNPERWLVDLYLKIAFPFANFIIVLFGAPLAVGRLRSSGAVGVALTLVIAFLYFGTVKTGQTLAQSGSLAPLVGAWMGNTIFFVAGLFVLFRARK
ncbi:MAG: LptF/LptG family permease [candidate division KSB1 bacterium]